MPSECCQTATVFCDAYLELMGISASSCKTAVVALHFSFCARLAFFL